MTKEEFLAFSLPYGLKCYGVTKSEPFTILSVHFGDMKLVRVKPENGRDFPLHILNIKPILRPLSDLTKEIEHKGEKFVPIELIEECCDPSEYDQIWRTAKDGKDCKYLSLWIIQKLIEWHFDIAGLIEKGEAIDVNTLEINPYK